MQIYHKLLEEILENGHDREARYGPTRALFAKQMRFDLGKGFPAITTKKLAFRTMATELAWFISGSEDNKELTRLGCNIWTANAEADYWKEKSEYNGHLGRVYGVQWRRWKKTDGSTVDQLAEVIEKIKTNPSDRRLIVNAWNPGELDQMVLPPCHTMFQFFVHKKDISIHMYQRSADMFLGVPFNIASYALLLHVIAQITDLTPKDLVITLGDAHICHNHFDQVKEQLSRDHFPAPKLILDPNIKNIDDISIKNFQTKKDVLDRFARLENYKHHAAIYAPMGV